MVGNGVGPEKVGLLGRPWDRQEGTEHKGGVFAFPLEFCCFVSRLEMVSEVFALLDTSCTRICWGDWLCFL